MPAIVLALLLVVLAGCGTGSSERDVAATVDRFQAALTQRDGAAACAELTPSTRASLESQERAPCARAVLELDLRGGGSVASSDVYMNAAVAEITGHGSAFLDHTADGWRISATGCTPTPRDRPYDCELEG
jgi:hypothetical protein